MGLGLELETYDLGLDDFRISELKLVLGLEERGLHYISGC